MAEDGPLTPEKQLLRLIEEGKGAPTARAGSKPPAGKGLRLPSLSGLSGILSGRLQFFRRQTKKRLAAPPRRRLDLAAVNRILMIAVAAVFLYVAGDAAASAMSLMRPLPFNPQKGAGADEGPARTSPLSDASYYLEKASLRDIFREGGQAGPKDEGPAEAVPVENVAALSGLSLVGISWSNNPDVIIEDKDNKRTYFVKRGQTLGNGVKVEAVFKDHVLLSHEGREFELR